MTVQRSGKKAWKVITSHPEGGLGGITSETLMPSASPTLASWRLIMFAVAEGKDPVAVWVKPAQPVAPEGSIRFGVSLMALPITDTQYKN